MMSDNLLTNFDDELFILLIIDKSGSGADPVCVCTIYEDEEDAEDAYNEIVVQITYDGDCMFKAYLLKTMEST